ncbi:MAG: hypothetical protein HC863_02185 [Myxococcales bacterium]|nr:hypothetical protein [Myxococcales bacterium]
MRNQIAPLLFFAESCGGSPRTPRANTYQAIQAIATKTLLTLRQPSRT